jgi:hypothetical protein
MDTKSMHGGAVMVVALLMLLAALAASTFGKSESSGATQPCLGCASEARSPDPGSLRVRGH